MSTIMDERPTETQHAGDQNIRLLIPHSIKFSDLKLAWGPDQSVEMDQSVMLDVLGWSNICPNCFFQDAQLQGSVMLTWYKLHLAMGGGKDPVMEHILAEMEFDRAAAMAGHAAGNA